MWELILAFFFSFFNLHHSFQKSNPKGLFYFLFIFPFCHPLTTSAFLFLPFSFFLYIFFSLSSHFHTHDATFLIVDGTTAGDTTIDGVTTSGATTATPLQASSLFQPHVFSLSLSLSLSIFPTSFLLHSLRFSYMKSCIPGCHKEHSSIFASSQATHGRHAL